MIYLESFTLPTKDMEDKYLLGYPYLLEMQCYNHSNVYPFRVLSKKELVDIHFDNITFLYGSNGSGKSTLLNIIAEKLNLTRSSDFNKTPFTKEYLKFCKYNLPAYGKHTIPKESKIITSDDVFDYLLDIRALNRGIENKREFLLDEYDEFKDSGIKQLQSMEEYDEFKRRLEVSRSTKSRYVTKRLSTTELQFRSNGENAFGYFTENITSDALYLLDEPENSLSAELQLQLLQFIQDSARFYNCQFIISTHSPFLLSMKNALIYDLDTIPVAPSKWTDLENVRTYYNFFKNKFEEFK